tara:strand:- start:604 stop:795 length:192 start_codon:yes stop_codon:yes gene_type:complete
MTEDQKPTKRSKYRQYIYNSEPMQDWLKNAPSQLLDYDIVTDNKDGLMRIRILLKNAYLFDED